MKPIIPILLLATAPFLAATPVSAQEVDPHAMHGGHAQDTSANAETDDKATADHAGMDHSGMDHSGMDHSGMDHSGMDHSGMDHGAMNHDSGPPRTPIPAITDADRAAANRPLKTGHGHGDRAFGLLRFNRLEAWNAEHGRGQRWEGIAWYGSDLNRVWIRSEGERAGGVTESADLEVLYGRSVSPWWDALVGVRHDFKPGHGQSFVAAGIQGMAPQKFEIKATLYLGERGQHGLRVEAEREIPLSGRLVLQPLVEAEIHGRDDRARDVGAGLATIETGLRLRYEITRRFAPYIGIVNERAYGDTARYRKALGERDEDTVFVAGVRLWF